MVPFGELSVPIQATRHKATPQNAPEPEEAEADADDVVVLSEETDEAEADVEPPLEPDPLDESTPPTAIKSIGVAAEACPTADEWKASRSTSARSRPSIYQNGNAGILRTGASGGE